MKKIILGMVFAASSLFCAEGTVVFERVFGGAEDDMAKSVVKTEDGYLIVGDKKTDRRRDSDVWVLKVNLKGKLRKN